MATKSPCFLFPPAKNLERHYLLSGDADGTIFLWEFSLADKKVLCGVSSYYRFIGHLKCQYMFASTSE